MSVDSRLRDGLERSAANFVPTSPGGAGVAASVARRRRTSRRVAGSAAVVVALAVGAGWALDREGETTAPPVPAATVPSDVTTIPTTPTTTDAVDRAADAALAAGIMGEWRPGVVSVDAATTAMVRTGTSSCRRCWRTRGARDHHRHLRRAQYRAASTVSRWTRAPGTSGMAGWCWCRPATAAASCSRRGSRVTRCHWPCLTTPPPTTSACRMRPSRRFCGPRHRSTRLAPGHDFPPDAGTFTFAPQPFRCEAEGSVIRAGSWTRGASGGSGARVASSLP